jgi:hypothetical protein
VDAESKNKEISIISEAVGDFFYRLIPSRIVRHKNKLVTLVGRFHQSGSGYCYSYDSLAIRNPAPQSAAPVHQ